MVTKTGAKDAKVDWKLINQLTEVPRTYLVTDKFGNQFFKMYKPTEAQNIFKEKGWKGQIVSILHRGNSNGD